MSTTQIDVPHLRFICADNGVYYTEIRPTLFSLGVLIELAKNGNVWTGTFMTFHASPQCNCNSSGKCEACTTPSTSSAVSTPHPVTKDMVSAKISLKSPIFKELIAAMRVVFDNVPSESYAFTNEERAAIEVATELLWRFPKKIIGEIAATR